jgi:hypothetical protein
VKFNVKVQGRGLCLSCKYSTVVDFDNGQAVQCGHLNEFVQREVVRCNAYREIGSIDLWQMERMAWLVTEGKDRKVGFVRPGSKKYDQIRKGVNLPGLYDD